jgi:hypothetical protein
MPGFSTLSLPLIILNQSLFNRRFLPMSDANVATADVQAQRLEAVSRSLASLLRRPDVALRLRSAGPDEWSALQIMGHMIEVVPYWTGQARSLATATGAPPHFGRTLDDPERLEGPRRGAGSNPDELAHRLDNEVRMAAAVIRSMTPAQRARTGMHNRLGEITVAAAIQTLLVDHLEDHEEQVKRALGV